MVNSVENKRDGLSLKPQLGPVWVNSSEEGQNSMRATRAGRDLDEEIIIIIIVIIVIMIIMKLGRQNAATS